MKTSLRIWISLVVAIGFAAVPFGDASAQCEVCPTTSVVAYQPVAAPVVTPIDPNLITGWYPGKLLDRWAANRAAYRATAATTAVTAAYRPVGTAVPVTSYRPVTSVLSTSYMPVSVYRPLISQPVIATTAYSPITATTAYSPIVTSSAACCDPCSTGTVASYPATTSACCGVTAPATSYGGTATPQPSLGVDEPIPSSGGYQESQRPTTGATGSYGSGEEGSVLDQQRQRQQQQQQEQSGGTGGAQQEPEEQQGTQQNGAGAADASFQGPIIRFPDRPADEAVNRTARHRRTDAVPAIYTTPVRPQLVRESRSSVPSHSGGSLPSRAERDAGWTAVD